MFVSIYLKRTSAGTLRANNSFNKVNSETKYKLLIENEINKANKKWCEITKIIKVEDRFERC